ncbi:polysaccharide export protein [Candidatus Sumerlaeota bacterium]|nr:polysaccharide export protein [Candidatus Sumerlaeota bacterium]
MTLFHRQFLLITTLCAIVLTTACQTRGPNSPYVAPPYDPSRQSWEGQLEKLRSQEMQLPKREDYYIGPGDVLSLSLVGRQELLGETEDGKGLEILVTENPLITLPLVGAIRAHGKTPQQLEEDIKVAYSKQVKDPVPVLTIQKYYANQVAVLGSVKTPGKYPLEAGDTVLDSVFKAGGLTFGGPTGNLPPARILKVYREKLTQREKTELTPEQLVEKLKEADNQVIPRTEIVIPLDEFLFGGNLSYNIPVVPNDIVFIPPAGTVSVHGQVTNPRVVFLGPSLRTVVQVITETGGLKYKAASRIEIVRTNSDGSTVSFFMHARKMLRRDVEDFVLQDNDQVFIYKNTWRTFVDSALGIFRASVNTGINTTYSPIP